VEGINEVSHFKGLLFCREGRLARVVLTLLTFADVMRLMGKPYDAHVSPNKPEQPLSLN
jgi:hypothetical protein